MTTYFKNYLIAFINALLAALDKAEKDNCCT